MNKIISSWFYKEHIGMSASKCGIACFHLKMGFLSLEVQKQLLSNSERLRNLPKSMDLIKSVLELTLESDLKAFAKLLSEWW